MLWPLEEAQVIVDEAMRSESRLRRAAMQERINDKAMPLPTWEQQRLKDAGVEIGPNGHPVKD